MPFLITFFAAFFFFMGTTFEQRSLQKRMIGTQYDGKEYHCELSPRQKELDAIQEKVNEIEEKYK